MLSLRKSKPALEIVTASKTAQKTRSQCQQYQKELSEIQPAVAAAREKLRDVEQRADRGLATPRAVELASVELRTVADQESRLRARLEQLVTDCPCEAVRASRKEIRRHLANLAGQEAEERASLKKLEEGRLWTLRRDLDAAKSHAESDSRYEKRAQDLALDLSVAETEREEITGRIAEIGEDAAAYDATLRSIDSWLAGSDEQESAEEPVMYVAPSHPRTVAFRVGPNEKLIFRPGVSTAVYRRHLHHVESFMEPKSHPASPLHLARCES